jgi:hypothetical protein
MLTYADVASAMATSSLELLRRLADASIRQHTSAYGSIRQLLGAAEETC